MAMTNNASSPGFTTSDEVDFVGRGSSDAAKRPSDVKALTVSQAMGLVKRSLEAVSATIVGEISEFSNKPGYKAIYFTITDKSSALPCLIWRNVFERLDIELRQGLLIEVSGTFSVYAAKGRMNFNAHSIRMAGEGNLRLKVAQLARKLELEGLMDPARKKALSKIPERIAVVTSPRGKAVHDVLRTLRRRFPLAHVYVAGVPVEGEGAPLALREGIRVAEQAMCDVILLVRGGGSYEDLMPFNDESLARSIAACTVPIVTGIGHEPDNSIADMVSDMRASTPTAAAETVVPEAEQLQVSLNAVGRRLAAALSNRMERSSQYLTQIQARPLFSDAMVILGGFSQGTDLTGERLFKAIPEALARDGQRLGVLRDRMVRVAPGLFDRQKTAIGLGAARLEDLSPLSILARGYAISYDSDGRVLRSVDTANRGDSIEVRLNDGTMNCTVDAIRHIESVVIDLEVDDG